jgi:hypothetical protein
MTFDKACTLIRHDIPSPSGVNIAVNPINEQPTKSFEQFLERPSDASFYDLLGGLTDNLLTIGGFAGTFATCTECGDTWSLRERAWTCSCCHQSFEVKFGIPKDRTAIPLEVKAKIKGLAKPGSNPHWFYDNENWSVAEFIKQLHSVPAEPLLAAWLPRLGIPVTAPVVIDTLLAWPRLRFGKNTIQPDYVVATQDTLVLFEFKRPSGGTLPGDQIAKQIAFTKWAAEQLGRSWAVVIVPGPDAKSGQVPHHYAELAIAEFDKKCVNWQVDDGIRAGFASLGVEGVAAHLRILGWESLIERTEAAVSSSTNESWSRRQVLRSLRHFRDARSNLGLLATRQSESNA